MTRPARYVLSSEQDRERVARIIRHVGKRAGVLVEVEIRPLTGRASRQQMRLIHKWFDLMADATGDAAAAIKLIMKQQYLESVEHTAFGVSSRVWPSLAELSVPEMAAFMESVHMFAVNTLGLHLPQTERELDEWLERCHER